MSKISELDFCLGELRSAAQSLNAVAESLTTLFDGTDVAEQTEREKVSEPTSTPKPPTLEQVRAVLADKSRDGYTAQVRDLLKKHGADKLSAVDPANYAALLADAEVQGDG